MQPLYLFPNWCKRLDWVSALPLLILGLLLNSILVILATIFVYGVIYFNVLVFNTFTPLAFFIIRFNRIIYLKPGWERNNERSLIG